MMQSIINSQFQDTERHTATTSISGIATQASSITALTQPGSSAMSGKGITSDGSSYPLTAMTAVAHEAHQGWVIETAIAIMKPTAASIVQNCWSSCLPQTVNPTSGCFSACTAANKGLPTPRPLSFRDAAIVSNNWYLSFLWGVLWTLAAFGACTTLFYFSNFLFGILVYIANIVAPIFIYISNALLRRYRHRKSVQMVNTNRSFQPVLNAIDAICKRQAKNAHDKAFGLRSTLQKILRRKFTPPGL
jgi:hypothetical protein